MAIQKSMNLVKNTIVSIVVGVIFGAILGGVLTYQTMSIDHFTIHKTNVGMIVFVKDKVYNLNELKSMD